MLEVYLELRDVSPWKDVVRDRTKWCQALCGPPGKLFSFLNRVFTQLYDASV